MGFILCNKSAQGSKKKMRERGGVHLQNQIPDHNYFLTMPPKTQAGTDTMKLPITLKLSWPQSCTLKDFGAPNHCT